MPAVCRNRLIQQVLWTSASPSRRIGVFGATSVEQMEQVTGGQPTCWTRPSARNTTCVSTSMVIRQTAQRGRLTDTRVMLSLMRRRSRQTRYTADVYVAEAVDDDPAT